MGNILQTKDGLVIDRPGRVMFIPVTSAGSLDYANAVTNTAVINTMTITNSKTKTEIPDGNSFYPAGDRVTAISGTIAIEFSTVDPAIWAMCSGTSIATKTSDTMIKLYDYQRIDETAGTIVLDEEYAGTDAFVRIIGSDGTVYEKVTSTTKAGEYSIATTENKTTITFNTADKGKAVAIAMTYKADTYSYSQDKKAMANHKIIVDTEMSTVNDSEKIPVNFIISQASVTGDMVEALQKDPSATKTLTFTMYAPLAGEKPYEVKYMKK